MKKCVSLGLFVSGVFSYVVSICLVLSLLLIPFDSVKAEESESVSSDEDFVIEDGVLIKYKGSASEVVIPEGVTKIGCPGIMGKNGLNYSDTIKRVALPRTLKEIGAHAFYMCHGLSEIEIPEGVTTIGTQAFADCTSLAEINIPEGVTTIGTMAFWNCEKLSKINIPESVTDIGSKATFELTPWLEERKRESDFVIINNILVSVGQAKGEATIPEGVMKLVSGSMASAVREVYLPESLVEIDKYAFSSCSSLKEVHMKNHVEKIGDGAFEDCWRLKRLEIPKSVQEIGERIFSGLYPWELPDLLVYKDSAGYKYAQENELKYRLADEDSEDGEPIGSDSDFVIEDGILYTYKGFASEIVIPEGVTKIGGEGFRRNGLNRTDRIKSVVLPDSLKEIEVGAFESCSELSEITIPEGVTKIGSHAFANCMNLSKVYLPENLVEMSDAAFLSTPWQNAKEAENIVVKVQRGDTLWGISHTHLGSGLRYKEIMKLNGLKNTVIYAGQELKVPAK